MNNEIEKITIGILSNNFDLSLNDENLKLEQVRKFLIDKLTFLIDHDLEKLFSILYRIDVKEEKATDALMKPDRVEALADLIIERQFEKAKTRMEYKNKKE